MTEDSGRGQPQKTVAELLAQHGAQVDGGRRRRRRAADDDEQPNGFQPGGSHHQADLSDTAPQAIIDRVTADSGTPLPRRNGGTRRAVDPAPPQRPPATPESAPFSRPAPPVSPVPREGGQSPRPQDPRPLVNPAPPVPPLLPAPQESAPLPLPARGRGDGQPPTGSPGRIPVARARPVGPPPMGMPRPGGPPSRLDDVREPEAVESPQIPPLGPAPTATSGTFQAPVLRPRHPPAARLAPPRYEDHTEQFAAVVDDVALEPEPVDEGPAVDEPPAGLANWRKRRRKAQLDDTEVGAMPPVHDEPEPLEHGNPLGAEPPGRAFVPPPSFAPARATPPEGYVASVLGDNRLGEDRLGFDHDVEHGPNGSRPEDEYDYDNELDDYDGELEDEPEEQFDEQASPLRQWVMLAGQLALGVVGGAAVWLSFNWLWFNHPAAALVAALVVVVGLVWIVRKIRRAEDLQTTVLAVLVGLVATVSPAALLLLAR